MTTPPRRRPPAEPAGDGPPQPAKHAPGQPRPDGGQTPPPRRPAGPGAGLAAPRPEGQGAPRAIPAAAAAEALLQSGTAATDGAGQSSLGQGAGRGRSTAEIQLAGLPAVAGAAATTVLGQRTGVGLAQGEAVGRGQGQAQARGQGAATQQGASQAVGAPPQGVGRRDREPDAEPEPLTGPVILTRPTPSHPAVSLLGIRAGQLVTWELAVLAVALVYRERLIILIPVAVVAVIVVALTAIRRQRRYLYQWLGLWLRYKTRHRRRQINDGQEVGADEIASTLLSCVVRGAVIAPVEIDEIEVALISHAGGLTAVLEVTPLDAGHVVEPSQVLPPLPALLPAAEIGEPLITAQIIIQSIPAPNFLGLADSAAISYRELAGGVVPATRGCWLALQAEHVAEEYTAAELQESVIRAVKRLQRRLRKAGLRARLLNRDEVATELLSLARVDARHAAMTGRSRRGKKLDSPAVQESWRTWSAGPQIHTTFRLLDWPDLADPAGRELLDRLVHTPTLVTTVTVAARRRVSEDDVELEAAIRVTLPGLASVNAATKEIQAIVAAVGGRVERLDGEQVFGVAATLPLGGFLS